MAAACPRFLPLAIAGTAAVRAPRSPAQHSKPSLFSFSQQTCILGMRSFRGWRLFFFCLPLIVFLPLFFSVSELHRKPSQQQDLRQKPSKKFDRDLRQEPSKKFDRDLRQKASKKFDQDLRQKASKKFDRLVLGPAPGQGLPDRLQCQGLKALNSTRSSSYPHILSIRDSVSFVTVFSVYNSSPAACQDNKLCNKVTVGNASYTKVERALAILDTFIDFIQVSMPRSNVIILSDPASELPIHRNNVMQLHIPGDYAREKLMLQRIKSYIAFLEARFEENFQRKNHFNHYIFTDSDVAVVDDLGDVFNRYPEFHLALTFRNNKDQPLNSGFIAVRGTPDGIMKAKIFLQKVLEVYSSKYMKASRMLGDQLALAWVVKSYLSFDIKRFTRREAFLEEIHGASVLFLPCAIYNWTPPEGAGQFHGMPLDVKVVHFKGSRKRLMLESWSFYISSSSSDFSDTLCLILKSGRRKYDF